MIHTVRALLVHGMGQSVQWWDPLLPVIEQAGIAPEPLSMPSLLTQGPEAWVKRVVQALDDRPTVLVGHSLGAAVVFEACRRAAVDACLLLALPGTETAATLPESTGELTMTALARVAVFLRSTVQVCAPDGVDCIHLYGTDDPAVAPVETPDGCEKAPVEGAGHELNACRAFAGQLRAALCRLRAAAQWIDPGLRFTYGLDQRYPPAPQLELSDRAPPPARLDIEPTTRCQLACRHCARTLSGPGRRADITERALCEILRSSPYAHEVVLVGLGAPLLHPRIVRIVAAAREHGGTVRLVTNGLAANRDVVTRLADAGLSELAFSVDSTDARQFAELRGGADLSTVVLHLQNASGILDTSVVTALGSANGDALVGVIELASSLSLRAVALSDLNFEQNQPSSMHGRPCDELLAPAFERARELGILLVGPRIHNVPRIAPALRYCIVPSPSELRERSRDHAHCLSAWRCAVIDAHERVSPCNCAPDVTVGRLGEQTLTDIWNGGRMRNWRRGVLDGTNRQCRCCPRY